MSQDTDYKPVSLVYKSRGLAARNIYDQCPEYTYIDYLNIYEREENSVSSRYGTQVVNRDAVGIGTSNHYFSHPVTSLSRMNYQSNAWRYAGLGDGSLWRRAGNAQGAYTQLTLPSVFSGAQVVLSGNPFASQVDSCFETSQPFLFMYDQNASIKDQGTGSPQLTGIDPSPYTMNTVPYAPLLTMIDSFATGNSYSTSNVTGWSWATIETLNAQSGQLVQAANGLYSDFSQFYGISLAGGGSTVYPLAGTQTANATQTGSGGNSVNSSVVSGFGSVIPTAGQSVSVTATINGSTSLSTVGYGGVELQYTPDGGVTWITFYSNSSSSSTTFSAFTATTTITTANLNLVQFRSVAIAAVSYFYGTTSTLATVSNVFATVTSASAFGPVANGMLSILNTNTSINIPIASVTTVTQVGGLYTQLLVTTSKVHGLSIGSLCSIYATTNDVVDGFYQVATVPTTTTFTVPFISAGGASATNGYVGGGNAAPSTCVLTDEYSSPYPSQLTAYGFNQWVPPTTTAFPVSAWGGTVAASTTGYVEGGSAIDLTQGGQVTDDDLIVITLKVSNPANISQIQLQFFVGSSGVSSPSYYSKYISPAYYQGGVNGTISAYQTTENQILADTLGLITGAPPNSITAQLQPSNISTGAGSWIACYMRRGDFLPVGQAGQPGVDWTAVTAWKLSVTTNSSGTASFAVNGLYLQWGYGPSSFGGVGYDYRYTYYNANTGTESSPCPTQAFNDIYGFLSSQSAPIFLRQASQNVGYYSFDPQVTHVRIYRRGGTLSSNWFQVDQIQNITGGGQFTYKDVTPDAFLLQATPLALDNDPPVTSSLLSPIQTTLTTASSGSGQSIYSTFSPQTITVTQSGAVFVPTQIVNVGSSANLEQVMVITGGTGTFTAVLRLQHNANEQVNVYAVPRQACNLCALAYNQMWLAGDKNNPHYLYFSKKGQPESFAPQNYIPVSTPDDPINAVINWRGTLIVGTLKSWFIIVGGAQPYAQPTGSVHGIIAQGGWCEVEGAVFYRSTDGWREFTGADGVYKTLMVEWVFQNNPLCIVPQANISQASQDVMCYYNNQIIDSYISLSGQRYRMVWDSRYGRFRYDDVPATAMLWEKDINTLLVGKQMGVGQYAIVQDQVGDYDDGGWVSGALVQTPITVTIQTPYHDLGKPHLAKQWNEFETDVNTKGQDMYSTLLFEDGTISLPLSVVNNTTRQKVELFVNNGMGEQAYRASIQHSISVTTAPILYQDDIYAALLAEYSSSIDSYFIKFGTDTDKFVKQGWFDYTSTYPITGSLYADNSLIPYFTFTLPMQTRRYVMRVRFGNVNNGTTAFTCRTWRIILNTLNDSGGTQFQMWEKPRIEWKTINAGDSYKIKELEV